MVTAVALVLAALFGAGDQYLGSVSMHPWMTDVSLLSAPWLVLAFLAGCTQREPKRAALLGIGCTFSALIGYGAMTLSPIEGAHMSVASIAGFVRSQAGILIGGVVTGPVFGWFGQRWRVHRAWRGALATAAALCFEPLARIPAGHAIRSSTVLLAEVAVGIAMATYLATRMLTSPQAGQHRGNTAQ
jgi:MFS family permease